MLVICNGLYKSGSTWIFVTLLNAFNQKHNDLKFYDKNQDHNPNIYEHFDEIFHQSHKMDIVTKVHTYNPDLLEKINKHNCFYIFTDRANCEILQSHYYHFVNENKIKVPYVSYALTIGFLKLLEVEVYRFYAKKIGENCLIIQYSEMKVDMQKVVSELNDSLGLGLSCSEQEKLILNSDMRNKNNQFMNKERPWFFSRTNEIRAQKGTTQFVCLIVNIIFKIVPVGVLRKLFMLIKSRKRGS